MNMRRAAFVGSVALTLFLTNSVSAQTFLQAILTNGQENPPAVPTLNGGGARPASFGTALFVLNAAKTSMTFTATVFNIDFTGLQTVDKNDDLLTAHIHADAVQAANYPAVWGFFGIPFNDNNPNDNVITPFLNGVGGTISGKWDLTEGNGTTLTAQIPNILAGRSYIDFHTTQFGGGEVRGALVVTPEPSTVVLLSAGLFGVALVARRRKQNTR
ncbi:MAG: CHRD domain-containing protein [Gemmatimonadaceae bacterium]